MNLVQGIYKRYNKMAENNQEVKTEEEKFKRNVAYKLRISDISSGNPIISDERFNFLDLNGKKIVRVNVIGSIVDKYESEGEKNFVFLTLDDGSGQIKLKAFGEEADKLRSITHGQTVIVIGNIRYFNNEIYISPEIVRESDPKYLLVRKIELEGKGSNQEIKSEESAKNIDEKSSIKEKILESIKNSESNGGIETESLISNFKENESQVKEEIQRLLEEGIIFEPLPGKVRWLG